MLGLWTDEEARQYLAEKSESSSLLRPCQQGWKLSTLLLPYQCKVCVIVQTTDIESCLANSCNRFAIIRSELSMSFIRMEAMWLIR